MRVGEEGSREVGGGTGTEQPTVTFSLHLSSERACRLQASITFKWENGFTVKITRIGNILAYQKSAFFPFCLNAFMTLGCTDPRLTCNMLAKQTAGHF